MLNIYLCHVCLWPIWFPHGQKTHIGTGWPCWKEQQDAEEEENDDPLHPMADFASGTPPESLEELTESVVRFYESWRKRPKDERVLALLREHLQKGRTDVVYNFLRYLTTQRDEYPGRILHRLTETREWKRFGTQSRRRAELKKTRKNSAEHKKRRSREG